MKKYKVEIKETLQRVIEVQAQSAKDAIELIRQKYKKEEIVLSENDYISTEIDLLIEYVKTLQLVQLLKENPSKIIEVVLKIKGLNFTHFIMMEDNVINDEGVDGENIIWSIDEFQKNYSNAFWVIDYIHNEINI
ncbi:MAG: DpnD/PcfM family protein [Bacteroidales bacterium]|jgi:hypothetical protein|nr:DpnD/PcfM family protein [Bacteroidales bacterium]